MHAVSDGNISIKLAHILRISIEVILIERTMFL